ncbi:golgin subfamily A member 2-like [Dipodomys spectabilis]|uniref:golgin subfamily A member 2-like n=1 Tax=Dipodomys spectabilis TaxID=105255 RepID=UPI001C5495CA|nr:golgin subfamily A member 2-like [Dipodomys spectabilis]
MSEQTRQKETDAGQKLLQEFLERNCPDGSTEANRKKKTKKGSNLKANITGDQKSTKGMTKDTDPALPAVSFPASVLSIDTGISNMSEVLLLQFSRESPARHNQQKAIEERAELEKELQSMKELVTTLRLERDSIAEKLRVESSMWNVQQLLEKMSQLREEKGQGTNLLELRKQLAELLPALLPVGPSQAEQQLQAQAYQMQKKLKNLEEQLYIQVRENQSLHLQNLEQQERLWFLEQQAKVWNQHAWDQHRILETMERDHETTRYTLLHNRELKDQLAQLQDAFHRLSSEKEELASVLRSEQQVKRHLQEKLVQLEKNLGDLEEMAESKSQAAQNLQEQHDQSLAQLQELRATCEQHMASIEQLISEKEALQQYLLNQTQLLEQLKQEQVKSHRVCRKLQNTLKSLKVTRHQNEQLRAQLSFLAFPREGKGVDKAEKGKEVTPPDVSVPEDVDNPQTMWDFYLDAMHVAESKKERLSRQLREQQARCSCLANLAAQCQIKLERQTRFPESRNHNVAGERKQDAQAPNKKLKICFTHNLPRKVDYQKQSDELQHGCSQMSEHMTAIAEATVFSEGQMANLDELAQEKQEKKEELQELLWRLAGEGAGHQGQIRAAAQTPAAEAASDFPGPTNMEVLEERQAFGDVKFEDNLEAAQREAGVPWPLKDRSTDQIALAQPNTQHLLELAGLDDHPCFPLFYRTDGNDALEIIIA